MGECIEREAVLRAVHGQRSPCRSPAQNRMLDCLKAAVIRIPAADVAPVVHGRWSDAGFGELPKHAPYGWACSACGGISFNNEYIYCPNCGAMMDGERKDGANG